MKHSILKLPKVWEMLLTNKERRQEKNVIRRPKSQLKNCLDSLACNFQPFIYVQITSRNRITFLYIFYLNIQGGSKLSLLFLSNYNWLIMWFRDHYHQRRVLYADNCPEQPYIIENKQTQKVNVKKIIKKQSQDSLTYHPKIIKTHRFSASMREKFEFLQHGRQLSSLHKRIKNCKSLSQRKKDHNDPIIYPSYFIREQKYSKDARIDGYFRQVVSKKPKKSHKSDKEVGSGNKNSPKRDSFQNIKKNRSEMLSPKYSKGNYFERNSSYLRNLPNCNAEDILRYLQTNQIFKITDIFHLKVKMKKHYDERVVEQEWFWLMEKLGLFKAYNDQ